jgi:hypothetical protein
LSESVAIAKCNRAGGASLKQAWTLAYTVYSAREVSDLRHIGVVLRGGSVLGGHVPSALLLALQRRAPLLSLVARHHL